MIENKVLQVLFNEDEHFCRGNMYSTLVFPVFPAVKDMEFFTANPLDSSRDHLHFEKEQYSEFKPRRADMNVTKFRNFVYEMDGLALCDQRVLLEACGIPWSTIVYSGGKSLHALVSLENPLEVEAHTWEALFAYKNTWHRICAHIDKKARELGLRAPDNPSVIDKACSNPSRFTRYPNSLRKDKGNIQEVQHVGRRWNSLLFTNFLDQCPEVHMSTYEYINPDRPEKIIDNETDFMVVAPKKMVLEDLKYTTWGGVHGGYENTFRICMWAIDDLNVTKDLMLELFDKYVVPRLIYKHRYNDPHCRNIYAAIDHAFKKGEAKYGKN